MQPIINAFDYVLEKYKATVKESMLRTQFEMLSVDVRLTTSKTGNEGIRFWFICPKCERRVGILLIHPLQGELGCRKCLGLEYRKVRFKGMLENSVLCL